MSLDFQVVFIFSTNIEYIEHYNIQNMKQQVEIDRLNYANAKHHKELLHQAIDESLIQQIQLTASPSLNYKNAFRSLYQDELQKALFQQQLKEKQNTIPNQFQMKENVSYYPKNSFTYNNNQRSFVDFEEQKKKRNETLVQRQLNQGHSFFKAQDQYLQRKNQERQVTRRMLQQQLIMKQKQKLWANQLYNKEVQQVKQNSKKIMLMDLVAKQREKETRYNLGQDIKRQIEDERSKKQHKSLYQMNLISRHHPITNPIEYHIQNPYLLQKMRNDYCPQPLR